MAKPRKSQDPSFCKPYQEKPNYVRYDKPVPITSNHRKYHNLLKDKSKQVVVCTGWAGVGKSCTSSYYASQALLDGYVDGVVLVRSLEGVGKNPGAYPGSDVEKNEPKLRQLLRYISSFTNSDPEYLLLSQQVIICGLYDIQGMDFTNKYVLITEAQTLTPQEMYIVLTRGAKKIVLEGDTLAQGQCTNRSIKYGEDGLSFLFDKLDGLNFVGSVVMDNTDDIVRCDYIKEIIIRMSQDIIPR